MSNTYFKFKQFTVQQDNCAMKVCTDACLFGAWVAEKVGNWQSGVGEGETTFYNVLDIGTGTGLLSLMLAQKINAHIDAVEIDFDAADQAAENFNYSPWKERLQIQCTDIKNYQPQKKYDLIISNPPFFENDLKSHHHRKNLARHEDELPLNSLLNISSSLLNKNGKIALLIPWHRLGQLKEIAEMNALYITNMAEIKQTTAHSGFRAAVLLQKNKAVPGTETIIIKENNNTYSPRFIELSKNYYLYL